MSLSVKKFFNLFGIGLLIGQLLLVTALSAQIPQNLSEIRKQGFSLLQTGNWESARTTFEKALDIAPKDSLSLYGSSLALFNLKRLPEANYNLETAIEVLSQNKENNQLLADSLVLSAVISAVRNETDLVVTKLEKAIQLAPKHFDANFTLGRAYFGSNDTDKAVYFFRESVMIQPKNVQARFFLATALERGEKSQEAMSEYRKLIELNPKSAEGNLGLGVLLIKTEGEKSVEGLKVLQKAIELNPNLYEAQITFGKTLVRLNRAADAIEPLQKAVQLAPENPEPHFQLAIAYRKLGKTAEADAANAVVKRIHASRREVIQKPQ